MSFSDHKITAFQHKITDLPDQPTLSPQELKARFDSSPEELRKAVNGICDEGERLSARVEGIVTDTFGDMAAIYPLRVRLWRHGTVCLRLWFKRFFSYARRHEHGVEVKPGCG